MYPATHIYKDASGVFSLCVKELEGADAPPVRFLPMLEETAQRWSGEARFAAVLALIGIIAGVGIWLLTTLLSRSTISGNGWSLAGNGALVVPFGLGPAIVAAGWTAIILRMRGHPRWLQFGVASGLIALVLVAGAVLSLVAFGPRRRDAGATGSLLFGFLLYGWLLACSIVAVLIPAPDPARSSPPVWSIAAIVLLPATLIAGCEAGTIVLPT